jgi:hypothetical protein
MQRHAGSTSAKLLRQQRFTAPQHSRRSRLCALNSSSSSSSSSSSRRGLLLRSTLLPLPLLLVGSDDATTIVNSILSGYGLPTLKPSQGFKAYDEFEDDYVFECECSGCTECAIRTRVVQAVEVVCASQPGW